MPSMTTLICTILAFVIPLVVNKIYEKLHSLSDPPWKREDRKRAQNQQQSQQQ